MSPPAEEVARLVPEGLRRWGGAVLRSYAQVLFSRRPGVGLLLLAATFVVPSVGFVGLGGVLGALACAHLLQLERASIHSGVLGYNALLVFLAVGSMLSHDGRFVVLAMVTVGLVVVVHVALGGALAWHFRLPVLSVPFVGVSWMLLAAVPHVRGLRFREHLPALALDPLPGPVVLDAFLRTLGAIFFQPYWFAGLLVFAALWLWSRIGAVHAVVGFGIAWSANQWWFALPSDVFYPTAGLNFVVTAIALGGVFYVPSAASLGLASAGALTSGLVAVGSMSLLAPVGLPVLAGPFNGVVLVSLYALGQRARSAPPHSVDFFAGSPEENLAWWRTRVRRFRSVLPIRLKLPVRGTWICTQGSDGSPTHRGPWRHAVDLEVVDLEGARARGAGTRLEDWYCYRLPVVAPAAGRVVRVVDGHPDLPVGEQDLRNTWGNLVMIEHSAGLVSMVAHLSPGTIGVSEGQRVVMGQLLGLCGASGRSPVPHLHVQLQSTSVPGDPTCALEFHGIVVEGGEGASVPNVHLPREGERVRNPSVDLELCRMLDFAPGRTFELRSREDGAQRVERVRSDVDAHGRRFLRSEAWGTTLWFDRGDDAFLVYELAGSRRSDLVALYVGLVRVPLDDASELRWEDVLDPGRLGTWVVRWLRDVSAVCFPPPDLRMVGRVRRRGGRVRITGRSRGGARGTPEVETDVVVDPVRGVVEIEARIGTRFRRVEIREVVA